MNKIHIQKPRTDTEYYSEEKESAYFLLEVFFAVHELPISFSLQDVVLKYRGKDWRPVGAYSLVKYWDTTQRWGHNLFWPLCANPEHKSTYVDDQRMITSNFGERMKRPSISVSERMMLGSNTQHCFSIEFEMIKPDPRDEFNVEFSIRVNDKNIPIRIKYVPGTVRSRHAMQSDYLEKHSSDIGSLTLRSTGRALR